MAAVGCTPVLRGGDTPFITDERHYILDCQFAPMANPAHIADQLKAIPGVIEHGLFIGLTQVAIIATDSGIEVLQPV